MGSMVAKRMKAVKGSPTVQLSGLVSVLRAQGHDLISLAIGEPDFATPAHIVEAAKKALDEGFTKYTPSPGIPELREAISEKTRLENGIPCEPKHVLVSSTKHALFATILAFAGPGDDVLLPDPGWVSYLPMVQLAGARPVLIPCPDGDGFQMTAEAVAEKVTPKTKIIVVNSPNNPTGSVYTIEALRGIADLAADHNFLVATDEIYEKIVYGGEALLHRFLPGSLREDHHSQWFLQDLRHDRMEAGLGRCPGGASKTHWHDPGALLHLRHLLRPEGRGGRPARPPGTCRGNGEGVWTPKEHRHEGRQQHTGARVSGAPGGILRLGTIPVLHEFHGLLRDASEEGGGRRHARERLR